MFVIKYIRHTLIISLLCGLSFANLKFCSQSQDKLFEIKACLTNETGYSAPFPLSLDLDVTLKNIIKIDEDSNSISIQANLLTSWTDPGLSLNHG